MLLINIPLQILFEKKKSFFIFIWDVVNRFDIGFSLIQIWCCLYHLNQLWSYILCLNKTVHKHWCVLTDYLKADEIKNCFLRHDWNNVFLLLFFCQDFILILENIFFCLILNIKCLCLCDGGIGRKLLE